MSDGVQSLIDQFVSAYSREFDFHREAARICQARCEAMLSLRGLRSIVTNRAKDPQKLRSKLEQRNSKRPYTSLKDIRDDIADLAGVRIALYFPGDRASVGKLISEHFDVEMTKTFPEASKRDPKRRFDGYHADHFRVKMTAASLPPDQKRFSEALIEIQLGSVLMHAWAEVEHDLIYKPDSGYPSEDETAILDELNGLVLSGEISLERLQRAQAQRRSQSEARFENHYELAAFLHNAINDENQGHIPPMGRVDALWTILRESGKNRVADIAPIIDGIAGFDGDETMADQVADAVLREQPQLYNKYIETQSQQVSFPQPDSNQASNNNLRAILGEFLSRWIITERTFSLLYSGQGEGSLMFSRGMRSLEKLSERINMPEQLRMALKRLRTLRNIWVHGTDLPSPELLSDAIDDFERLFYFFETHPEQEVRDAYRDARHPLDGREATG